MINEIDINTLEFNRNNTTSVAAIAATGTTITTTVNWFTGEIDD